MTVRTGKYYGVFFDTSVLEKTVSIIRNSNDRLHCKVVHREQLIDPFGVKTSVNQGCLLSPFLFLLAVQWIMKTSTPQKKHGI